MTFEEKKLCRRCVLPEVPPEIVFDSDGVCSLCREYQSEAEAEESPKLLESDLLKILAKQKKSGKYDILAMCSGGKDSTSALYYMKKRYKLTPLAFMFDNGFESQEAIDNVHRATEKLGVDLLFYKTNYMKEMYSEIVKSQSKAVICHPCSLWYMDLAYEMADRHEIPVIIAGWTKGQSTQGKIMSKCGCNASSPEFKQMSAETKSFLANYLKGNSKYKDFPSTMEEVIARASKRKNKAMVLSPHWFLPYGPDVYVPLIQKELGWKFPELSYPGRSTNCSLNFVASHLSMKNYGYTHYHVEMSKLIRQGVISREEALRDLEFKMSASQLDDLLAKVKAGGPHES